MHFRVLPLIFTFILAGFTHSCQKDETDVAASPTSTSCDLQQHVGHWEFVLNGDPSTTFIGQIDKYNNNTLNITYQPTTAYDFFLQTEVDCETGLIPTQILPAGNHGSTTIEGSITDTMFEYKRERRINYTGTEQVTTWHIIGTKQ